jgi:hypothetical protein
VKNVNVHHHAPRFAEFERRTYLTSSSGSVKFFLTGKGTVLTVSVGARADRAAGSSLGGCRLSRVLYVAFGKARVGSCAELLGCVVGNCAELSGLLGRCLCLELHSLICAFECLEMHSCIPSFVDPALIGLLGRCLELH